MQKNCKKILSVTLAAAMVMTMAGADLSTSTLSENVKAAQSNTSQKKLIGTSEKIFQESSQATSQKTSKKIKLSQADIDSLTGEVQIQRASVHDPSIVYDNTQGCYYVFGSHMAVAKTNDLRNWTGVANESTSSKLFGDINGNVVSYEKAFNQNAFHGPVTVVDKDGNKTEMQLGNYDIDKWNGTNTIQGNMWAPDILYNSKLHKWCMYESINGADWNSAIVLLTSDNIEGPYVYQAPIIFTGFYTKDSTQNFKDTDLEMVIGQQDELPLKYQKMKDRKWGDFWPHAIDPCVYYDENGQLWMTYGSWSGGIYTLQLDENTGLRDYTVRYDSDYDQKGQAVTTDEYFGKKIAGGCYVSGEGSYIQHIGDYYYLFNSYGFFSPEGGYNMRVFRSKNPDGPFEDTQGNSPIFDKYIMNYSSTDTTNNRGEKLMGGYQWDTMPKGEVSQGHNSAIVDKDGKAYVVYHTKFNDGTASHELRVHQLFMNEKGWLCTAPYEYAGETLNSNGYSADEVVGNYGYINHKFQMDYEKVEINKPESISLNADGTISGTHTGTWKQKPNTPYCTLQIDGKNYSGVFTKQIITGTKIETMCFTAVGDDGVTIWGSMDPSDKASLAQDATSTKIVVPEKTYSDIELPAKGEHGSEITWKSNKTSVLGNDGKVKTVKKAKKVTLTETISNGKYYFEKKHKVIVSPSPQNSKESMVVGKYYTNEELDLSKCMDGSCSVANPVYRSQANGLDLSGGVSVEFDIKTTGDLHALGTIFSFMGDRGSNGRVYFTPGSYLGYNAAGTYYDANLNNYKLVKDYIKDGGHVKVEFNTNGFALYVNDKLCYDQTILDTENGEGTTKDYKDVLNWLQNSADRMYFGYGSWWNNVNGDEANAIISNVVVKVGPTQGNGDKDNQKDKAVKVRKINLSKKKLVLKVNKTKTLKVKVNPKEAKKLARIFESSNEEVATVDEKGKVTAKKVGKATITVTVGNKKAKCKVIVKKK